MSLFTSLSLPCKTPMSASACPPRPVRLVKAFIAFALTGLIFFTLGLLSAQPARAQQSQGHYWQVSYAQSGDNCDDIRDIPNPGDLSHQDYPLPAYTVGSAGGGGGSGIKINGSITDTISATLTWVPATGQDNVSDPPPIQVHIKEYSRAWEQSLGSGSGGGTVDDGLGDPPNSSNGDQESQGLHLLVKNGSSGTIALDAVTVKAINATSNWVTGYPGGGSGGGYPGSGGYGYWDTTGGERSAGFSVVVDADPNPRSVMIISSIDPTYHKDPATGKQAANVPAFDGTMTADSAKEWPVSFPAMGLPRILYNAVPIGSWNPNSSYHWYSSATGQSDAGTFQPPTFPVGYPIVVSGQEHVNIHCIDASDSASATANYYVNWHDSFEGWNTLVDVRQTGVMTRVTPVYFPTKDDATFGYDLVYKVTVSQKATGEGSLGTEQIGAKFGVELGVEYESETGDKLELSLYANKYNWVDRQAFWRHREGLVDNYDSHGYEGMLNWTLDAAYNPSTPLIDFVVFQRSSDTPPSY